jgi:hypothetical protein
MNPVGPVDRTIFSMDKEANHEFSIYQSHTPTKMAIPVGNGNLKPRLFSNGIIPPRFLSIAQKNPFSGFKEENPYNHLRNSEQLCSTHSYSDLSLDEFKVRLFPFSLEGKARAWYFQQEKEFTMNWSNLCNKFSAKYFPYLASCIFEERLSISNRRRLNP